jgi:O-antigen chain-terminating methyltransferase
VQPSASNQSAFDSTLYADFELRFRGSQGDIKERFSCYRDVLDLIPRSGHEFLDLGCGRGEFLEFLSQHQVACSGVDSDEIAVEQCMRKGLRAQVGDLVSYLSGLEEHSVSGVSLLHVIEHLPVQTALDVLREAHRVITPEGIVIVETPNPKNLRVGSSNFWLDPTHLRPYPPELTGFMIETVGFVQSSTKFLRSNLGLYDVDELEPQLKVLFDVILTAIDGPADYAIVAKKSARIYS